MGRQQSSATLVGHHGGEPGSSQRPDEDLEGAAGSAGTPFAPGKMGPRVTALASPARPSSGGCTIDHGRGIGVGWGAVFGSRWSYIFGKEGRGFWGGGQRA